MEVTYEAVLRSADSERAGKAVRALSAGDIPTFEAWFIRGCGLDCHIPNRVKLIAAKRYVGMPLDKRDEANLDTFKRSLSGAMLGLLWRNYCFELSNASKGKLVEVPHSQRLWQSQPLPQFSGKLPVLAKAKPAPKAIQARTAKLNQVERDKALQSDMAMVAKATKVRRASFADSPRHLWEAKDCPLLTERSKPALPSKLAARQHGKPAYVVDDRQRQAKARTVSTPDKVLPLWAW